MLIRNIIVEGSDQQGKSTMCKYLNEKLGWNVIHFGKPPLDFNFHSDYITDVNTISDRNFLSEIVYSNFRGNSHRVVELKNLQDKMLVLDYLLILVDREDQFVFENREEDFSASQISKAIDIYRTEFENITFNKVRINPHTDMHLIDKLINENCKNT